MVLPLRRLLFVLETRCSSEQPLKLRFFA